MSFLLLLIFFCVTIILGEGRMGEEYSVKRIKREFRCTPNGYSKHKWMIVGVVIDIIATLCVSLAIAYSYKFSSSIALYVILFALLVIVVLGGELIGVYFGAREQYIYNKKKKALTIDE